MKAQLTLCCLLFSAVCMSQNFEGTIKWSISNEITDPAMKKQMEDAQKKMNDPKTKAEMKEMQEKMNSPEMKAMMDQNPQMKAQMEASMKMMQGGDMNSMMPKGFMIKIKNGNTLTSMDGGIMAATETLYLKDKNQSYMINKDSKTYTVVTPGSDHGKTHADVKVKKTTETQKILNYTCTKTIVTVTENGTSVDQIFWTTTEIKDFDLKTLSNQRMGEKSAMFYEGIEGVPLKMEMTTPQMKIVSQVVELKREPVPASIFAIPAGFTESKMPGQGHH